MIGINEEGFKANEDGYPRESCPYELGTIDANCWLAGWDEFQPIREQLEEETYERARTFQGY